MTVIDKERNKNLLLDVPPLKQFIESAKGEKWGGFARQNRYKVQVFYPAAIDTKISIKEKKMVDLLCEQAVFPGKSINLSTISVNGLDESRAKTIEFEKNTVAMSFLVDRNLYVKSVFDRWMNYIISPTTKNNYLVNGGLDYETFGSGRVVNYFDEYVGTLKISSLLKGYSDNKDSVPFTITLNNAYPTGITPITYSSNSQNILRIGVSFAFTSWDIETYKIDLPDESYKTTFKRKLFFNKFKRAFLLVKIIGGDELTILRKKLYLKNPKLASIIRIIDSIPYVPFRRITRRF